MSNSSLSKTFALALVLLVVLVVLVTWTPNPLNSSKAHNKSMRQISAI